MAANPEMQERKAEAEWSDSSESDVDAWPDAADGEPSMEQPRMRDQPGIMLEFENLTLDIDVDKPSAAAQLAVLLDRFSPGNLLQALWYKLSGRAPDPAADGASELRRPENSHSGSLLQWEDSQQRVDDSELKQPEQNEAEPAELKSESIDEAARAIDSEQPGLMEPPAVQIPQPILLAAGYNPPARNANGEPMKRILSEVTARVRPGRLTIVLGGSGAGKSSLLRVLAGRSASSASHQLSGSIRLDGREVGAHELSCLAGFCMQDDCFLPMLTPMETLKFKCKIRAPVGIQEARIESHCKKILQQLGLERVSDSFVGAIASGGGAEEGAVTGGVSSSSLLGQMLKLFHLADSFDGKGLSGGEQRRLSIGLELIQSSRLLLLDECTSKNAATRAHSNQSTNSL